MKRWLGMLGLGLILFTLAACGGNEPAETSSPVVGPALVMFYTDN